MSAVPRPVARERLPAAIAVDQVGFQTVSVCGPAIGGIVIAAAGLPAASARHGELRGSAGGPAADPADPPLGDALRPGFAAVVEDLRFVHRMPVILSTLVIDLDAMIFGLPVALFPIMAWTSSTRVPRASDC